MSDARVRHMPDQEAARVRCCSDEANDGDAAAPRTPKRRWRLAAQEGLWE